MKIKNIAKLLVSTMLLNSISLLSIAGSWSDDGRYETFEGDSIEIDNVLEEDEVNVEVEGNTMVNLVQCSNVNITVPQTGFKQARIGSNKQIKPLTTYTIIYWAKKTDNHNPVVDNSRPPIQLVFGGSHASDNWGSRYYPHNGEIKDYHVGKFTTPTDYYNETNGEFILIGEYSRGSSFDISIVVLEGDWTNKELPKSYFEGMMSVGENENNNIEITSKSKNVALVENVFDPEVIDYDRDWVVTKDSNGTFTCVGSGNNAAGNGFALGLNLYNLKPNTTYTISYKTDSYGDTSNYIYRGTNTLRRPDLQITTGNIFTTPSGITEVCIGMYYYIPESSVVKISNIQVEESSSKTEYVSPLKNTVNVNLSEPLRSLPNGTKDRIIKKDDGFYIERNCIETILDGSSDEAWVREDMFDSTEGAQFYIYGLRDIKPPSNMTEINVVSDKMPSYSTEGMRSKQYKNAIGGDRNYGVIRFIIDKSYLSSLDVVGLKSWLSNKPIKVVHQLSTPIYEKISDVTISTYVDKTYITNISVIPANMSVTIDRVANRAKEAIELTEINPTVDNISQARFWTNLMRNSTLKDSFQDSINMNTDIEDLTIEKKSVSANTDVYVKLKNTLSLSLDTNSIVFNDVDSTQDTEIKNAVNLTVSSSLPYVINASLESEMYNKDKSDSLDKSLLNIKSSDNSIYLGFTDIKVPIEIIEEQQPVENKIHSIDLLLAGDSYKKADIYKSTLKFEVEQR